MFRSSSGFSNSVLGCGAGLPWRRRRIVLIVKVTLLLPAVALMVAGDTAVPKRLVATKPTLACPVESVVAVQILLWQLSTDVGVPLNVEPLNVPEPEVSAKVTTAPGTGAPFASRTTTTRGSSALNCSYTSCPFPETIETPP